MLAMDNQSIDILLEVGYRFALIQGCLTYVHNIENSTAAEEVLKNLQEIREHVDAASNSLDELIEWVMPKP